MPGTIPNTAEKGKVLVYLFGSLGDSIVTIPALRAIRRRFAAAEIVLLQNLHPDSVTASAVIPSGLVDRYLGYAADGSRFSSPALLYSLWRKLRRERFDAAVYAVASERSENAVRRDKIFFRSCGIRRLFGFHAVPPEELYPVTADGSPAVSKHEALFKLERLERDGISFLPSDLSGPFIEPSADDLHAIDTWLAERRQRPDLPLISIGPGCKQQVNVWDLDNFRRLGERLMDAGLAEVVVVGGPGEFDASEQLVGAWGRGMNAAGAFSVARSGALFSRCSFHIGVDTGTTHLAAAAGTRCFALYGGRNNQGAWYPLGAGHTVVFRPVECSPCRLFICAVPGHPCMAGISLEFAWEQLSRFLTSEPGVETTVVRFGDSPAEAPGLAAPVKITSEA